MKLRPNTEADLIAKGFGDYFRVILEPGGNSTFTITIDSPSQQLLYENCFPLELATEMRNAAAWIESHCGPQ